MICFSATRLNRNTAIIIQFLKGCFQVRLVFFVNRFPVISETFILNRITGLMDRGCSVDIFSNKRPKTPISECLMQDDVIQYGLLERTTYTPKNKPRVLAGLKVIAKNIAREPMAVLRCLNVFRFGRRALSLELLISYFNLKEKGPYDIIHCNYGPNGELGALLKRIGIPGHLTVSFHGYDMSKYLHGRSDNPYSVIFEEASLLLPVSEFFRNRLIDMGAPPEKTVVHRMGIDLDYFHFRERYLRPDESVRLLTIGRLSEKKGIEYALKALYKTIRHYQDMGQDITFRYDIVGDGPLSEKLQMLVTELGLNGTVIFHGSMTHGSIREMIEDSHIFILPCTTSSVGNMEGIPNVIKEALASGLPVLSTWHSGIPELVEDGVSGFLVPERDVDSLSERLVYLTDNPGTWSGMGAAGREFVEAHYDERRLNDRLLRLYQEVLDDH